MSKLAYRILLLASIVLMSVPMLEAQTVQYLSPKPGSLYNMRQTTIIIGFTDVLTMNYINSASITVTGSSSGNHTGRIIPVEGYTRLIFKPDVQFAYNENVLVTGLNGQLNFSFQTEQYKPEGIHHEEDNLMNLLKRENVYLGPRNGDDLPQLTIHQYGTTAEGYLFFSNFQQNITHDSYLMALHNNGTSFFSRLLTARAYDFKKQPNNMYTYYEEMCHFYLGLDQNFNVVDSFFCGNGYTTDLHELQLTEDGGAWLMSYDVQTINMSQIIPGGAASCSVTGLIVQKIDANKNVVFQWRSWDHIPITDATHEDLLSTAIDYIHGNAIETLSDNNILISSRHIDEITKISANTGDIIWRLGGKHNMFTFTNDTMGFSHQHCIRYLGNDHYILFDNGNFHSPPFSRAVEYKLNESDMTATKVWEYRNAPDIFSFAMGSVERLSNGNTLIGWGSAATTISEVNSEGELLYQLSLPAGQMSYRAYRYDLQPVTGTGGNQNAVNYTLFQNYPNPFNPVTTIKFTLPESSFVNISIYDITGRKVSEILNKRLTAGQHSEVWNGARFSSGVYFCILTTDKFKSAKKMILIK